MRGIRLILLASVGFSGATGCDTVAGEEASEPTAIYNGTVVPVASVSMTGAVEVNGGCSGTLVTPWWVLTAQHCHTTDQGIVRIPGTTKSARIAPGGVFNKPGYVDGGDHCTSTRESDVTILKLASPIYLSRSDGKVWDLYTRNLDRAESPAPPNGAYADLYSYGCDDPNIVPGCTGFGVQRFGSFYVNPHTSTFDFDGAAYINHGDSGGGLLRPSLGTISQSSLYSIAGIAICTSYGAFWDPYGVAVSWSAFADFFDATIPQSEFQRFNAPARIVAALVGI